MEKVSKKEDTFTRQEVIEMLREMQEESIHTVGFINGHLAQLWVVRDLIGKRIKKLDGEEVEYTVK